MTIERNKWLCAWVLSLVACDPRPGSDDGDEAGEESSEGTTGFAETTDGAEGSASYSTGGESGYSESGFETESCTTYGTASVSSTTWASEDDGGDVDDSGGGAAEQCGVELEYVDANNTFMCGCAGCDVQYDNLSQASADALLAACDCICEAVGCGISVTGGVTSEGYGEDGEGTATTATSDGGETGGWSTGDDGGWDTETASDTGVASDDGGG